MYCRYCGKELPDNAVICSGCGRLTVFAARSMTEERPLQAEQKKEKISKSSIAAFMAFFFCIVGTVLGTIVATSNSIRQLVDNSFASYVTEQFGQLVVSGIFSILALITGVISFGLSIAERVSVYKRVFSACTAMLGIAYFIEFVCAAVVFSVAIA